MSPGCLLVGLAAVLAATTVACGSGDGAEVRAAARSGAGPLGSSSVSSVSQDSATDSVAVPAPGGGPETRIRVAGISVTVEIADDAASRERGLMFRESLPPDHGMLFVYETERVLQFWMRNTRLPLDIGFLDRSGRIVDIQQMEPMLEKTHSSRAPAMYALEMAQGWFEEHGVKVGDQVEF